MIGNMQNYRILDSLNFASVHIIKYLSILTSLPSPTLCVSRAGMVPDNIEGFQMFFVRERVD